MKIPTVEATLLHEKKMDGQTDVTKLIVVFRNSVNAPTEDKAIP